MDETRPIIIVKKKSGHAGHHGGAWKVAYADFVTAMMALFIVLWLLNSSKPVREAIAGYFRDPAGTAGKLGTSTAGPGAQVVVAKDDMSKLKEEIEKAISHMPNFDKLKDQIEIKVTPEGLRIELLESAKGTFFDLGSPKHFHRGSHGFQTLQRKKKLWQLGTFYRPRQLCAPPDAATRAGRETDCPGAWLCRPAFAQA